MNKECLCLNCIYGSQPYGYFPIVCVHGKKSKDMYHEVFWLKDWITVKRICPDKIELEEAAEFAYKYIKVFSNL